MTRRAWSPAAEEKLRALYPTTPLPRIAFLLKRTEKSVKSRAKLLGVKRGNHKPWTPAETALLRRRFPHETTKALAKDLKRTETTISQKAIKLGLCKSAEHLASEASGRIQRGRTNPAMVATQFPKGHVPANKGLRQPGFAPGRMAETQFRKGRPASESRNYLPIGSEKLDSKRGVIVRKITDDPSIVPAQRWRPVHTMIWEAANGKVPTGHIVIFKPGMKTLDSSQITLEHVELVTLAENMRRNTVHNYPKEIGDTYRLIGAVTRQINKRTKNEKQNSRPA